jgi:uncharacterized protein YkwD
MLVYRRGVLAAVLPILGLLLVLGPGILEDARALPEPEEQRFLELVNEYRNSNGLDPLVSDGALSTTAAHHSEDMATYGFFSHETEQSSYYPEGSGYVDRMAWEGHPTYGYIAENIAWGQPTAEEAFEAWRVSPVHDANMLDSNYTTIGIGHVAPYWTTDFFGSA